MDSIIQQNQTQIDAIQQNPVLVNEINTRYDSMANVIYVTNSELKP